VKKLPKERSSKAGLTLPEAGETGAAATPKKMSAVMRRMVER